MLVFFQWQVSVLTSCVFNECLPAFNNVLSIPPPLMIPTHCTAEELFKLTETELGIFSTQEGADNSMVTRSTISNFSFFESLEKYLSNGVIKIHICIRQFGHTWSKAEKLTNYGPNKILDLNKSFEGFFLSFRIIVDIGYGTKVMAC